MASYPNTQDPDCLRAVWPFLILVKRTVHIKTTTFLQSSSILLNAEKVLCKQPQTQHSEEQLHNTFNSISNRRQEKLNK